MKPDVGLQSLSLRTWKALLLPQWSEESATQGGHLKYLKYVISVSFCGPVKNPEMKQTVLVTFY